MSQAKRSRLWKAQRAEEGAAEATTIYPIVQMTTTFLGILAFILFFIFMGQIVINFLIGYEEEKLMRYLNADLSLLNVKVKNASHGRVSECVRCPLNWIQRGDFCYLFSTEKMNWTSCLSNCKDQGGSLVVMGSVDELAFLQMQTLDLFEFRFHHLWYKSYWVGLFANASRRWMWPNGAVFSLIQYVRVPPVSDSESEICVYLRMGISGIAACRKNYHCVCKMSQRNESETS